MDTRRYEVVEREECRSCAHYRQHYVLGPQGRPWPLEYGHCVAPRLKERLPEHRCSGWVSGAG